MKVDLSKVILTPEETEIVNLFIKQDGSVRKSKPKVTKENPKSGIAAYVWRWVVFQISDIHAHQCMPVTCDFDLPAYDENGKWSCAIAREMGKQWMPLVDKLTNTVPKSQWYGINRWGRALGYL
jgi:hypothetical protein